MKLILYTGTKCPKCPSARGVVREAAKELDWTEGRDFVEKLIDGKDLKPGSAKLEDENYHLVTSPDEIKETPAALAGEDFSIEALMYQVASTPSIVIDNEAVFIGQIPSKEELLEAIKERIK